MVKLTLYSYYGQVSKKYDAIYDADLSSHFGKNYVHCLEWPIMLHWDITLYIETIVSANDLFTIQVLIYVLHGYLLKWATSLNMSSRWITSSYYNSVLDHDTIVWKCLEILWHHRDINKSQKVTFECFEQTWLRGSAKTSLSSKKLTSCPAKPDPQFLGKFFGEISLLIIINNWI